MNAKEVLSKYKPIIIIILLFSLVFFLRAQAVYLSDVPADMKPLYEDQTGLPYFSEMDSYYNYRMTQDYINHGYLGDTIINGTQWDLHSSYPAGRSAEYPPLIVYVTAFVYKFVNLFKNMPLAAVCYWIAPFIASLSVIPAYLFIRRLTNDYGGIAAGLLVGTAPSYFSHTFAGFFDTDMFNMLLPILVVWLFVESIRANNIKSKSIFAVLSALFMLIFAMAWEGWWYIFYLLIGTAVLYLLTSKYLLKEKNKSFKRYSSKMEWLLDQPALFSLIVFVALSAILIILYSGISGFVGTIASSVGYSNLQSLVQATSYPNVYVSVSELQIPNVGEILYGVGGMGAIGILPFLFGILSIPLLIKKLMPEKPEAEKEDTKPKRKTKPRRKGKRTKTEVIEEKTIKTQAVIDPKIIENKKNYLLYLILFTLWLLITGYAMTKGSRFIATFSLPIALGAGMTIGLILPNVKEYIKNSTYYSSIAFATVFFVGFCLLAINLSFTLLMAVLIAAVIGIIAAWAVRYLKDIKYQTVLTMLLIVSAVVISPVATVYEVSSSVTPGTDDYMYTSLDWIKNNTPQNTVITSWWDFGHLFAVAADRPVTFDGGSQNTPRAYWVGKALFTSDENLSAGILRMLTSSGDQGSLTLENYTKNTGKSVEILNKILPVDKAKAQAILINEYKLTPDQTQNVLKYTHPDNPSPHVFITSSDMLGKAAWWSYFGSWNFQNSTGQHYIYSAGVATTQQINGTTVIAAENGVVAQINGTQLIAGLKYSQGNETQIIAPHKLIFIQNNKVMLNQIVSNDSPISIILIKEDKTYLGVVMHKELEDSMFTRLFFMNATGLTKFKLAYEQPGVKVWNVN
ncbi:MAG: peptide transporter [Methanobacterium sp.]|uniref:STT3 domain-containing protein n=1 Tax=Methanobacterium sp. TaxID=2164 RepID=UPI003D656BF1|nr:peptide transporter [Methanobacterium sp.]